MTHSIMNCKSVNSKFLTDHHVGVENALTENTSKDGLVVDETLEQLLRCP